jgi:hypothetical protein
VVPPHFDRIEFALFGDDPSKDNPDYQKWRYELREAYERARASRGEASDGAAAILANDQAVDAVRANNAGLQQETLIHNIPFRVPACFAGRGQLMEEIGEALAHNDGTPGCVVLHGMRGVGKTTLAVAFATKRRNDYRVIWWVRADSLTTLDADFAELDKRLNWQIIHANPTAAPTTMSEKLSLLGKVVLIVFDNALDVNSLRYYLPENRENRVLITSNSDVWRSIALPIAVPLWTPETGGQFLIVRSGCTKERRKAEELSRKLEGLPLAHELAGAYCERLRVSLAQYMERFDAVPTEFLYDERHGPVEYYGGRSVAKTFALGISEATKVHPASEQLIYCLAVLESERLPTSLLEFGYDGLDEPLRSAIHNGELEEIMVGLRCFGLLSDLLKQEDELFEDRLSSSETPLLPEVHQSDEKKESNPVYEAVNALWSQHYKSDVSLHKGVSRKSSVIEDNLDPLRLHRLLRLIVLAQKLPSCAEEVLLSILGSIVVTNGFDDKAEMWARDQVPFVEQRDLADVILRILYLKYEKTEKFQSIPTQFLKLQDFYMKMKWGGFYYRYD